jgi:precorrin-6B C5,15-methyltransferase / cobalt-precorrin-6B C5,C15-methyltransferase
MTRPTPGVVFVVGVGADGWDGLPPAARTAIGAAQVLLGGPRQLALVPDIAGQERLNWPSPLLAGLPRLMAGLQNRSVTVLASGDPLVSGIGTTLINLLGPEHVRVLPAVSSVALAAARMGWPADSYDVITVVGRNPASMLRSLSPGRRLIVLSSDESTPAVVAELLTAAGYGPSTLSVLCDLGGFKEARLNAVAAAFPATAIPRLNLVCVQCVAKPSTVVLPAIGGLPDDAFEHDGQITKRDARASALARLAPVPGQLLWDVGAGAGSVAIEWARTDARCHAIAVERDPVRAARIGRNAARLGVPGVTVVTTSASEGLGRLPPPDAVFVGGGASNPGVLETCWQAMTPGGRMVVHGVTLETENLLIDWHARLAGELIRLSVDRVEPIGSFRGWKPARPIIQWSAVKSAEGGPP